MIHEFVEVSFPKPFTPSLNIKYGLKSQKNGIMMNVTPRDLTSFDKGSVDRSIQEKCLDLSTISLVGISNLFFWLNAKLDSLDDVCASWMVLVLGGKIC